MKYIVKKIIGFLFEVNKELDDQISNNIDDILIYSTETKYMGL